LKVVDVEVGTSVWKGVQFGEMLKQKKLKLVTKKELLLISILTNFSEA
jgi:hypothetical protein